MANNSTLGNAKVAKKDEFYTRLADINIEIQAYLDYDPNVFRGKTLLLPCDDPEWSNFTRFFALNFQKFGLKKLISTSYAPDAKAAKYGLQPSLFPDEENDPKFDREKWQTHGKIFVLDRDVNGDNRINIDDLQWDYLDGDGDFRSREVTQLRNESDFIITNPPFSLFREFLAWIMEGRKKFSVIGNLNAISYNELFPLLKDNVCWIGATNFNEGMYFRVPDDFKYASTYKFLREINGEKVNRVPGVCWFTNIEHGRRHEPLSLMTMAENLKFSKHKEICGREDYIHYDNFDAIEVPFTDAIPSDYGGIMGVPKTFMGKYCPEQFKIIGIGTGEIAKSLGVRKNYRGRTDVQMTIDGKPQCPYERILIQKI